MKTPENFHFALLSELEDDTLALWQHSTECLYSQLKGKVNC